MRRKLRSIRLLVVAASLLVAFPPLMAWSEETKGKDFEVYTLGEIVVEGSRSIARDIVIHILWQTGKLKRWAK